MYVVVEFLDSDSTHRAALRSALVIFAHAALARSSGCLAFDVGQDDIDGSAFLLYQRYTGQAAYRASLEHADYAAHRAQVDPWVKTRRALTFECVSEAGVA